MLSNHSLYCTALYSRAIKDLIADSISLFITGLFEFSLFFSLSLLAVTSATELHFRLWIFLFLHDPVFVGGYAFLISNLTCW